MASTAGATCGIGGGPINLMVLCFLFSMDTKTAASNSLYIILFSQAASLLLTLATHTVPEFQPSALILVVLGGILGGVIGRKINKKLDNSAVDKLFAGLMVVIICISVYKYLAVCGGVAAYRPRRAFVSAVPNSISWS